MDGEEEDVPPCVLCCAGAGGALTDKILRPVPVVHLQKLTP